MGCIGSLTCKTVTSHEWQECFESEKGFTCSKCKKGFVKTVKSSASSCKKCH